MNSDIIKSIKRFIFLVKENYSNIHIDFEYLEDDNLYKIWHNSEYLEYEDEEFRRFTGKLITKLFLDCDVFNIYLTYDYDKAVEYSNLFIKGDEIKFIGNKDIGIIKSIVLNSYDVILESHDNLNAIWKSYSISNDNYESNEKQESKLKKLTNKLSASNFDFALVA